MSRPTARDALATALRATYDGSEGEGWRLVLISEDGGVMPGPVPDEFVAAVLAAAEPDYESRVAAMAYALHEDCVLEWRAIAAVDPNRQITMHTDGAHYGRAHDLVRRLWPELDTSA